MATDRDFVEFVADQAGDAGTISFRKMFGEYALYCNGKIFALVCDNRLYIKPTVSGREYIGTPTEAPPYPGAKLYFLIEEKIDDREWLSELVRLSYSELPETPPKKKKSRDKKQK